MQLINFLLKKTETISVSVFKNLAYNFTYSSTFYVLHINHKIDRLLNHQ